MVLSKLPVPVISSILSKAWDTACDYIRDQDHEMQKDFAYRSGDLKNQVKFELKALGGQVKSWDNYRWKIAKATENYNKAIDKMHAMESGPCDRWVRVIAKRKYLRKRIMKLRTSVIAVQAVCAVTLQWLDKVDADVKANDPILKTQYEDDVRMLKAYAGAHETCSESFCMYKDLSWRSRRVVPTSSMALFFSSAAGSVSSATLDLGVSETEGAISLGDD